MTENERNSKIHMYYEWKSKVDKKIEALEIQCSDHADQIHIMSKKKQHYENLPEEEAFKVKWV